jgi:hypothetical protein
MGQDDTYFRIFRDAPRGFRPQGFLDAFGAYPWLRITGLNELIGTLSLVGTFPSNTKLRALIKAELANAIDSVAGDGRDFFEEGKWTSCNSVQLRQAFAGQAICYEKAVIIARAADLAVQRAARDYNVPSVNVYDHIGAQPSICVLEGLEEWSACQDWPRRFFENELVFLDDLELMLRPNAKKRELLLNPASRKPDRAHGFDDAYDLDQLILSVMRGAAITWKNARVMKDTFQKELGTKIKIRILTSRVGPNGLYRCSKFEGPFVGFSLNELNAFRGKVRLAPIVSA